MNAKYPPTGAIRAGWIRLRRRQPGLTFALVSFWITLLWVVAIRPLHAPDEPAYLQTVMEVRNTYRLPEIHFDFDRTATGEVSGTPGDAATQEYIRSRGIGEPIRLMPYESVQPPLYFMITGLAAQLVPPAPGAVLYLSRLIAALFGACTVYFCWAATRELAPRAPLWAGGVAGVIALLPEFCFNNARAGNDSLVNCAAAASLYLWFRGLRQPAFDRWMVRAGLVLGLGALSKLSALVLLPAFALVLAFRAWQAPAGAHPWRARLRRAGQMAAGAGGSLLLVCGWWFARNLVAYGEPSGTWAANVFWHRNLPLLNWADPAARYDFIWSTWHSFWGVFGWHSVLLPTDFYDQALLFALGLGALSGLALLRGALRWGQGRTSMPAHTWQAGLVLAVAGGAVLFSFLQNSLIVASQPQGRYLFLALLPAALLFTGGLYALAPGRQGKLLALLVPILWLAVMNAVGVALVL